MSSCTSQASPSRSSRYSRREACPRRSAATAKRAVRHWKTRSVDFFGFITSPPFPRYNWLLSRSQLGRERVLMEETAPMAANMVMMEVPP